MQDPRTPLSEWEAALLYPPPRNEWKAACSDLELGIFYWTSHTHDERVLIKIKKVLHLSNQFPFSQVIYILAPI